MGGLTCNWAMEFSPAKERLEIIPLQGRMLVLSSREQLDDFIQALKEQRSLWDAV